MPYNLKGNVFNLILPSKPFEGLSPDMLIDDRFDLRDFGVKGKAIHIPGHTLGSI